ncbi:MAG: LacI family DNA-binding transcriptional regulator [Formivibrio sp.]|nr:LacI family DNA-binding transcriptional regulator [Formivibrio sp.]
MSKTVEEIATEIGVSITTVRLVINGQAEKYRISAKTQKKIEDYVALHGYKLNHAARSLKLKRSEAIGFVVPELANAFFARLMAELEVHCRNRGLVLLTASTHEDCELENRAIDSLLARGVDGLVVAPCQIPVHKQLFSPKNSTAVVLVDRDYNQLRYPTVLSDNYHSGLDLARRMLAEAKGPVYFLSARADLPSIKDRLSGFSVACQEAGITNNAGLVSRATEDNSAAGFQMMHSLITESGQIPRAFMCSSLLVLEGALQQFKQVSGRIPPDILIGTFDDHAMLDLLPNRVLSVRQDEAMLAALIFERLLEQMEGKELLSLRNTVPCRLICRN